jgi:hypothetical protein
MFAELGSIFFFLLILIGIFICTVKLVQEEHLAKSNQVLTTIETKISDCRPKQLQKMFYIAVRT